MFLPKDANQYEYIHEFSSINLTRNVDYTDGIFKYVGIHFVIRIRAAQR